MSHNLPGITGAQNASGLTDWLTGPIHTSSIQPIRGGFLFTPPLVTKCFLPTEQILASSFVDLRWGRELRTARMGYCGR